jgi:hypothetical protein
LASYFYHQAVKNAGRGAQLMIAIPYPDRALRQRNRNRHAGAPEAIAFQSPARWKSWKVVAERPSRLTSQLMPLQ